VFAYCRTGAANLGQPGQVVVVANMGPQSYAAYGIPNWPWNGAALTEVGYPAALPVWDAGAGSLSLALGPFAVRVFTT
jgi:1,4-alpha-glucan branching enzyme